jgi:hypothetical protein
MIYDVIIVGSGLAGLYAAHTIQQCNPRLSFLILEKNKKQWIGGRANNESFYGTRIATGAGVGRKRDRLLKKLVREFGFDVQEFTATHHYSSTIPSPIEMKDALSQLREEWSKHKVTTTFERFAKSVLGQKEYKQFVLCSGYADYERAGAQETLYDYGMEDNFGKSAIFGVNWHDLVLKMAAKIGATHFRFLTAVTKISQTEDAEPHFLLEVETSAVQAYRCRRVIVATTIESLRSIFPRHPIYKQIESQPFLRVYGKFDKRSIPILKKYVNPTGPIVVPGPLQKIIAMNPDEGVYMIVYNDNQSTLELKSRTENTEANRAFYCEMVERALGINDVPKGPLHLPKGPLHLPKGPLHLPKGPLHLPKGPLHLPKGPLHLLSIRSFYWSTGTHYYKPLIASYPTRDEFIAEAQHPVDGILVVGEVVSKHQGWVEGALESVDLVVTKKWISRI